VNSAVSFDQPFGEPRRERADSARNHDLLLGAAQRLIDAQGVDAVTMSAVAEAAGVGKGTLYRHFSSKGDLVQALIDADQRDLQERTFAHLREHLGDPAGSLDWFLGEVIAFVSRHQDVFFSDMGALALLDHPAQQWWRLTIRGLLARLNPALDLDYAADAIYLLLEPRAIRYQQSHGLTTAAIADNLRALAQRLLA
jgi:AcrR family transcriptional regulator